MGAGKDDSVKIRNHIIRPRSSTAGNFAELHDYWLRYCKLNEAHYIRTKKLPAFPVPFGLFNARS
ncbi:MAG: hypothetical protein A3D92_22480 [Bacteroidetes bacterium RIFCSPHIGHO2_02_FULL_44_7]|nr:MAG: hypothetical protein A3D92_22480 [Bacteroidetes bacterium RIFCSPHIGHO2_02_FULL_44_7]